MRKMLLAALLLLAPAAQAHEPHVCGPEMPDTPVLAGHLEQADIVAGTIGFRQLFDAGKALFVAQYNICDGQGRPAATGTGEKRIPDEPAFIRTSAPESSSCDGCHAQPRAGGAGDYVANVFVLAQALDPVTESVSGELSNERNTLGMFGSGAIDMLAREMTAALQEKAAQLGDGTHILTTKGVDFQVTIAGGQVIDSRGVDTDLVIKPFHQAGTVVSVRQFTVNAFNHHHGMQAEERFDLNPDKGWDEDFDEDGVVRELTVGDVTAATIFQAALGVPGRVLPRPPAERRAVRRGKLLFAELGCVTCHRPTLRLDGRHYLEPNPYNPPGTFNDTSQPVRFDLTRDGELPRLERAPGGGALVRAYTDLRRHNLCDEPGSPDAIRFFCNEQLAQGRPDQDGRPGAEFFITRKLWDVGSSAPYGHRGDLTTIAEAILYHGGEGRAARDLFVGLAIEEQRAVVAFLKTLRVLPEWGGALEVQEVRR